MSATHMVTMIVTKIVNKTAVKTAVHHHAFAVERNTVKKGQSSWLSLVMDSGRPGT